MRWATDRPPGRRSLRRREGVRPGAQNPVAMVVLGIDPGTAHTGYGVVARRGGRLVALDGGVIETAAGLDPGARLAAIHARVGGLLDEHAPDALAVEDLYFGANARSAFAVGQARGVVLLAAGQRGAAVLLLHAAAGQGRGLRLRPRREGAGAADGPGAARARRAAAPRPRGRRARGRHLPRERRAAARGAAREAPAGARDRARSPARSRAAHDHVVVAAAASATGSRCRPRRCATRPRSASPRRCTRHLIVRDDALLLYGFATEAERDLFLLLSASSRVGPKVALAVLSGGSPRELLAAVAAGDTARLQAVPGHRQAHGGADRRRAAREGRRARRADDPIVVARGDDPRLLARDGLVGLGFSPQEAEELLDGAPARRPRT